jgi:hypothetical protein
VLACVIALVHERPQAQADALFSFLSNPWLNLHRILRFKGDARVALRAGRHLQVTFTETRWR